MNMSVSLSLLSSSSTVALEEAGEVEAGEVGRCAVDCTSLCTSGCLVPRLGLLAPGSIFSGKAFFLLFGAVTGIPCFGSSPPEALTLDTVCGAAIVGRPVWIEVHGMAPSGQHGV